MIQRIKSQQLLKWIETAQDQVASSTDSYTLVLNAYYRPM
jgi:hypothetical protein